MLVGLLEDSHLSNRVSRVVYSKGFEAVELDGGALVRFRARTRSAGRGFSADLIVLDEAQLLPGAGVRVAAADAGRPPAGADAGTSGTASIAAPTSTV